jgi:hypothetical protein
MNYPDVYYIKIKDGAPDGYPFLLDNLLSCGIDPRNSTGWMLFIPTKDLPLDTNAAPLFKVVDRQYLIDGGQVLESWGYRDMTDEEKSNLEVTKVLARFTGSEPDAFE